MPTYEYECKKCSHRFEVFQSMSDEPIKECPECGEQVRRLVSGGVGVIFKGSGFYVTDKDKSSVPKSTGVSSGDRSKKDAAPKEDGASKEGGSKNDTPKAEAGSKGDSVSSGDSASKGDGASSGGSTAKGGGAKGKAKPAA